MCFRVERKSCAIGRPKPGHAGTMEARANQQLQFNNFLLETNDIPTNATSTELYRRLNVWEKIKDIRIRDCREDSSEVHGGGYEIIIDPLDDELERTAIDILSVASLFAVQTIDEAWAPLCSTMLMFENVVVPTGKSELLPMV